MPAWVNINDVSVRPSALSSTTRMPSLSRGAPAAAAAAYSAAVTAPSAFDSRAAFGRRTVKVAPRPSPSLAACTVRRAGLPRDPPLLFHQFYAAVMEVEHAANHPQLFLAGQIPDDGRGVPEQIHLMAHVLGCRNQRARARHAGHLQQCPARNRRIGWNVVAHAAWYCEFKAFLGLPFSTCRADGPDLHDQVSEALVPLPEWPA